MQTILFAFASEKYEDNSVAGFFPDTPEGLEAAKVAAEEIRERFAADDAEVWRVPFGVAGLFWELPGAEKLS